MTFRELCEEAVKEAKETVGIKEAKAVLNNCIANKVREIVGNMNKGFYAYSRTPYERGDNFEICVCGKNITAVRLVMNYKAKQTGATEYSYWYGNQQKYIVTKAMVMDESVADREVEEYIVECFENSEAYKEATEKEQRGNNVVAENAELINNIATLIEKVNTFDNESRKVIIHAIKDKAWFDFDWCSY